MKNVRHIRLFINEALASGTRVDLADKPAHYLINVMRCQVGDCLKCFNAADGEFFCRICEGGKKKVTLEVLQQHRQSEPEPDLWLLFAPLKKDQTDFVIQKAVELGVSRIVPVITAFTNSEKVKTERYVAQAIEAAEQCSRLSVPDIAQPLALEKLLANWNEQRLLFFMDERRAGLSAAALFKQYAGQPAAVLIGPEGGFSDAEAQLLNDSAFVKNVTLGPRILRAETAAAAALAVWQAVAGDWLEPKEQK